MEKVEELPCSKITLNRNDFIKLGDTVDTNIYLIEEGTVRVFLMDDKNEQNIRFGYAGDTITSLDSFFTGKASQYYIQSIKKTSLKVISKEVFMQNINSSDEGKSFWLKTMEELVIQSLEREKDILTISPAERYLRVLKRSPTLFQEIPHKHIANYLRMTPETLSRLKKY